MWGTSCAFRSRRRSWISHSPWSFCDDSDGDRWSPGMVAEEASSPAAREACGPPAPGAHSREGKLASTRPGQ
eukprot:10279038-Alexandrium_andersonii.AAC.1